MPEHVCIQSPAKLNLALSVAPPGADGMHPVCTWMVTIDLCDELTVTRLESDRLSRYAIIWHPDAKRRREIDWSITRDLAVRAHLALEQREGRRLPVQMKLQKRIPAGGGLGGGSSNAAAMLRATNRLFGLGLSAEALLEVAGHLGSDVPFFVRGGSAVVEGIGERIDPLDELPELHAVVVFAEASCPTGEVYRMLDDLPGAGAGFRPDPVRALAAANGPVQPERPFNDLAAAAVRLAPELQGHLAALSALAERPAHLAGSGSSIFVLCDDRLHAEALASAVESRLDLPAVAVAPMPAARFEPQAGSGVS